MSEKEVILDLSKKIKFSDTIYISLGSLLLSLIILIIQLFMFLSLNNWIWEDKCWLLLLNFIYSMRGEKTKESNNNDKNLNTI